MSYKIAVILEKSNYGLNLSIILMFLTIMELENRSVTAALDCYVLVNSNWVHPPPGNPRGLAQKDCPGGWDLTFESCPGARNSTRAGILWKLKVKHFVRLLVLLVINRGCPKNC